MSQSVCNIRCIIDARITAYYGPHPIKRPIRSVERTLSWRIEHHLRHSVSAICLRASPLSGPSFTIYLVPLNSCPCFRHCFVSTCMSYAHTHTHITHTISHFRCESRGVLLSVPFSFAFGFVDILTNMVYGIHGDPYNVIPSHKTQLK